VKTMEDPARIAYGFLGSLSCIAVSSSKNSNEIPISHG